MKEKKKPSSGTTELPSVLGARPTQHTNDCPDSSKNDTSPSPCLTRGKPTAMSSFFFSLQCPRIALKAARGAKARGAEVLKHRSSAPNLNTSPSPARPKRDPSQRQPFAQCLPSKQKPSEGSDLSAPLTINLFNFFFKPNRALRYSAPHKGGKSLPGVFLEGKCGMHLFCFILCQDL